MKLNAHLVAQTNARHAIQQMEIVSHVKQQDIMMLTNVCCAMKESQTVYCAMENKIVSNVHRTSSSWKVQHHANHVIQNQNVFHVRQHQMIVSNVIQDSIQSIMDVNHVNHKIVLHVIHSMEHVISAKMDSTSKMESVTAAKRIMENIVDCVQQKTTAYNAKTIIS